MGYPVGAMERAMKVHEVILRALSGQLTWLQAADILGRSPRSIRRMRYKFERSGIEDLFDRRCRTPSPKRAPVAEVERVLRLYRERYRGFNVRHFWRRARRGPRRPVQLRLRQEGAADRGPRDQAPRPGPPSPPAGTAALLWRVAASRRQPPSVARAGARAVPHPACRRGRRHQAGAVCAVQRRRREHGRRHDGDAARAGDVGAADGVVYRPGPLGRPHPGRRREGRSHQAHPGWPRPRPARHRAHPGLLAPGPRPQRADEWHLAGAAGQRAARGGHHDGPRGQPLPA